MLAQPVFATTVQQTAQPQRRLRAAAVWLRHVCAGIHYHPLPLPFRRMPGRGQAAQLLRAYRHQFMAFRQFFCP